MSLVDENLPHRANYTRRFRHKITEPARHSSTYNAVLPVAGTKNTYVASGEQQAGMAGNDIGTGGLGRSGGWGAVDADAPRSLDCTITEVARACAAGEDIASSHAGAAS